MILLFYNAALMLGLLVGAPWWLWKMATTAKYREGLGERLGMVPARLRVSDARPVVWLHAVSVGEVLAAQRLVAELDAALADWRILISTTTRTGQEMARARFGAERVFYCPLDLPWAVRAYLKALKPKVLVLAETEFWPNLLSACHSRTIPGAVVNARISDRSWPRYHRMRALWRGLLHPLSLVLAQSQLDADRLKAIGCEGARVSVGGNLKFDVRAAQEAEATRLLRLRSGGCRFVVAGSTLEGEERALFQAWPELLGSNPNLVLVIAPRHPERFNAVNAQAAEAGLPVTRRSEWRGGEVPELAAGQVVLLDTLGELASVYSLASLAFVGGSLVQAGGHNPLEPAQFAVPIVTGPSYENFRAIVEDLLAHGAMRIAEPGDLAATLEAVLRDRAEAEAMGHRARAVFEAQAGATERCVKAICALVQRDGVQP